MIDSIKKPDFSGLWNSTFVPTISNGHKRPLTPSCPTVLTRVLCLILCLFPSPFFFLLNYLFSRLK